MHIIAHRGASVEAPENTAQALATAWRQGAAGAEVDVRMGADRELLIHHDSDLRRVTGHPGRVCAFPRPAFERLPARGMAGGPPARLLSLRQLLRIWPSEKVLFLEFKEGPETVPGLRGLRLPPRCYFLSFRTDTCRALLQHGGGRTLHLVPERTRLPWTLPELVAWRERLPVAGLAFHHSWLSDPAFPELKMPGSTLAVWTVDDPNLARQAAQLPLKYLLTNVPGKLKKALNEQRY